MSGSRGLTFVPEKKRIIEQIGKSAGQMEKEIHLSGTFFCFYLEKIGFYLLICQKSIKKLKNQQKIY